MEFYEHPAYIGFCDSLPKPDDRIELYKQQYNEMGFDDTVTWALDDSIARFILPRLKRYYEIAQQTIKMEEEFENAIKTMIDGFELQTKQDYNEFDKTQFELVNSAWVCLSKYHGGLWW
jgi:hypothetical protein